MFSMKNKRFISAVTALVMMGIPAAANVSCFCVPAAVTAHAEAADSKEQHIWDGTADTSWYYREHTDVEVSNGETTKKLHVFNISTPEELAGLAKLVRNGNSMEDTVINLTADIQLNDVSDFDNWENHAPANNWLAVGVKPMGTPYTESGPLLALTVSFPNTVFSGHFNGNGHTISGMYSYHHSYAGLFGKTNGIISNVIVKDSYVKAENPCRTDQSMGWQVYAGGIVGYADKAIISCCEFDGKVSAIGRHYPPDFENGNTNSYSMSHECCAGGIAARFTDGDIGDLFGYILFSAMLGMTFAGIPTTPLIIYGSGKDANATGVFNCINRGDVYSEYGESAFGSGGIVGTASRLNEHTVLYHCLSEGNVSRPDIHYGAMVGNHEDGSWSKNNYSETECYYTNCDNSSYINAGINYTKAGMTKEQVAEKLGSTFKFENGEIRLTFAESSDDKTTTDTEVTTENDLFDNKEEVKVTLPAPKLTQDKVSILWVPQDDSFVITPEPNEKVVKWEVEICDDPDHTDVLLAYEDSSSFGAENIVYGKPYYVRVRGRTTDDKNDPACEYTEWANLTIVLADHNGLMGDVNNDGEINVSDISKLAAHIKGIRLLESTAYADVNNDGDVNVTDISLIAAHVKGIRQL